MGGERRGCKDRKKEGERKNLMVRITASTRRRKSTAKKAYWGSKNVECDRLNEERQRVRSEGSTERKEKNQKKE